MDQAAFTIGDPNQFQLLLITRIAELEHILCRRDLIAVEQNADQVDEVQQASERALAISNLDRDSQQLHEARDALRRLQQGSFGVCEGCGESIHFKRLLAVPWTACCIQCQGAESPLQKNEQSRSERGRLSRVGPLRQIPLWREHA